MASSKRSTYCESIGDRYRQGDVLRDVKIIEWAEVVDDALEVTERRLPYAVVLSQECDLEHDYANRNNLEKCKTDTDKFLQTILLCPAYPAAQLRVGAHLQELEQKMQKFNSEQWKRLKQNNDYRYHYLVEDEDKQVPELVIDFKHYFTIPRSVAYRPEFRSNLTASLDDLFREHLSSRFAYYLSRIGLPELESAA
ncbi:hypothetical protein GTP46_19540 [Duganella sp. FT135W]|uniref:Uncharacterized protein n=1 Tax=Duganella flavida TaxID=2692175 RepID=A0A6L8KBJ6_9BURK|nr:hypothetical protein [Duganella flavida]MYM24833.1 hypothetical protein [Duganella flavida]